LAPVSWAWMRASHRPALVTLCPSRAYRERLRSYGLHGDVRLWSRGVDAERFSPATAPRHCGNSWLRGAGECHCLRRASLREKRVDVLVDAFERIEWPRRVPWPCWWWVTARASPTTPPIGAGVHFTGFLSGVSLAGAYAAGDLFLYPSDTETFGNVVLEAMASGVPPIVASCGGSRRLSSTASTASSRKAVRPSPSRSARSHCCTTNPSPAPRDGGPPLRRRAALATDSRPGDSALRAGLRASLSPIPSTQPKVFEHPLERRLPIGSNSPSCNGRWRNKKSGQLLLQSLQLSGVEPRGPDAAAVAVGVFMSNTGRQ